MLMPVIVKKTTIELLEITMRCEKSMSDHDWPGWLYVLLYTIHFRAHRSGFHAAGGAVCVDRLQWSDY